MDRVEELQQEFEDIKKTLNTQGNGQQHKNVVFSKAEKDIDKLSLKLIHLLYISELIGLKKKETKRTGVTFEWIDD